MQKLEERFGQTKPQKPFQTMQMIRDVSTSPSYVHKRNMEHNSMDSKKIVFQRYIVYTITIHTKLYTIRTFFAVKCNTRAKKYRFGCKN